ncbi:hypothetical protein OCU04_008328 [Sclerotinia nivalis]|uniref:Thioesterase domain-containing protein n=1 Tax=Sclerotinia nivalis TaxID=352851 RepID=A0A9X0AHV2_9HELO|nr:hypothetical protein OCU04_008328 [Sclerotinia nivalis]
MNAMEAEKAYFHSIPWCSELLTDSNVIILPSWMREYKDDTSDSLLAATMKTPDTISHWLTFYNKPDADSTLIKQVNAFITFGNGLNGYPNIVHGGVVATVMDEMMGSVMVLNKRWGGIPDIGMNVAANLNVTYLGPITTPQTVLVSALFKEMNGRKVLLHATVKDASGFVLAKAEGLWVGLNRPKEKL